MAKKRFRVQKKLKKRNSNPHENSDGYIISLLLLYCTLTLYQKDEDGKLIDMDVNSQYLSNYRYYAL